MARPKKEIDKANFEKLCRLQCTKEEIAGFFDVSEDTIERWCKRTYKESFAVVFSKRRVGGKISLRRSQFKLAEKNANMAIWLGKQYLDQREPMEEKKLEVELLKLENQTKDTQADTVEDNTFIDALNGTAAEVWEESEVEEDGNLENY